MSREFKAWFTVDELNAWAEKKLKENPQWAEQPAQQEPVAYSYTSRITGAQGFSHHPMPRFIDSESWDIKPLYTQQYTYIAPTHQKPFGWKLVPIEPTNEMLKAMDECSTEGYDERLLAGHASSVYMAAVDVAPTPPQQKQEPVALEAVYETIIHWDEGGGKRSRRELARSIVSLYTTPPAQRTWVGLTDEEITHIADSEWEEAFVRMIEAKLRSKNT